MFGFSFSKILFTIVAVFAVFWIFRQINLISGGDSSPKVKSKKASSGQADQKPSDEIEDLSACPACGAYVAAGSNPGCGRPAKDCPMQS